MRTLLLWVGLGGIAWGQAFNPGITPSPTNPNGLACGPTSVILLTPNGTVYTCQSGVYASIGGGGGSGTVTSVTFNSPLSATVNPIVGAGTVSCSTCGVTGSPLSQFAATTSAQFAGVVSDASGTGLVILQTSPTIITPVIVSFASATHDHSNAAGGATLSAAVIAAGTLAAARGGTGVSNTATLTLGSSNQNWATLATAIVKNTTTTGALSAAVSSDVYGLWSGSCSASTFLRGDGACASPSGAGTVTVVGAGSLTSTALVTGGGTTTLQTPSATATMDSNGNISTPGGVSTGVGGSVGGYYAYGQGTATVAPTASVGFQAPTSVTTKFMMTLPAAPATGFLLNTGTSDPSTISFVDSSGTGNVVRVSNATMIAPTLGAALATTINKVTITTPATGSTLTIPDGVTLTGPSASGTVATLGLTNTFTGRQDAGGAASSAPMKVGTSLPGTCEPGDLFFKSDATAGQNIYECQAANTWTQQLNSGAGGASTALDNLASVSINTALLFQTGLDVGSTTKPLRDLYMVGAGTFGTNYFKFTGTPTSTRTVTIPDVTSTMVLSATSTTATQALFATATAGAPGYRAIATTDLPAATTNRRVLGFSIGDVSGSALTTSSVSPFLVVPFACTIDGYNLSIDAGTITVKFWKIATGTAVPTSSNSISTSGVAISSGTAIQSTTTSDFTSTAVAADDILALAVTAVATAKTVTGELRCAQ